MGNKSLADKTQYNPYSIAIGAGKKVSLQSQYILTGARHPSALSFLRREGETS